MPQIWMTYEEVADLLACGTDQALARIRNDRLDRKISHDGQKRVKLNLALIGLFLDQVRARTNPLDRAIADLQHVHGLMAGADPNEDLLFEPVARDGGAAAVA
ncbi:MAG: hypothetical protein K9G60_00750 [Pseudolabrys sp.]|nr:hypothetical protein [Pseudolabrys sp.]